MTGFNFTRGGSHAFSFAGVRGFLPLSSGYAQLPDFDNLEYAVEQKPVALL